MGPRERADTIAKRPQIPVLLSLISCPSEAKSSLPYRFLSVLPREINYVTTNSFPQHSSKGTLASSFSAHSLPRENDWGGGAHREKGEGGWERKPRKERPLVNWARVEERCCQGDYVGLLGFLGHPVGHLPPTPGARLTPSQ